MTCVTHHHACECREAAMRECVEALQELRLRLHAAGRRPEECFEMSMIDDALAKWKEMN